MGTSPSQPSEGMKMIVQEKRIPVDGATEVTALVNRPESCRPRVTPGLVLAHGQNNDLRHPVLEAVALGLSRDEIASVLRFNFPYRERNASSPDSPRVLEAGYRRAHDALADDPVCPAGPLFLGGKSLGARVAAELASRRHEGEGLLAAGLVFLGYPLHAPGRTEKLKTEPLRRIDVPSLFVQGSRDPFCDLERLREVLENLDHPPSLHVIEGGGHSYELRKGASRSEEEVYAEVVTVVADFIRSAVPNGQG